MSFCELFSHHWSCAASERLLVHAFRGVIGWWEWQTSCCVAGTSRRGKIQVMHAHIMPPRGMELASLQPLPCCQNLGGCVETFSKLCPLWAHLRSITKSNVRRFLHRQLSINSTNITQLFTWGCFSWLSLLNVDPHLSQWLKNLKLSCGSHLVFSRN